MTYLEPSSYRRVWPRSWQQKTRVSIPPFLHTSCAPQAGLVSLLSPSLLLCNLGRKTLFSWLLQGVRYQKLWPRAVFYGLNTPVVHA